MVRTIVGVFITLVCFALDPSLGIASAVVTGVWVLLGIGSVIRAAAENPTEHRVRVDGAVAHVVIDPQRAAQTSSSPRPTLPTHDPTPDAEADVVIECPRCSQYLFSAAAACSCGWVVSKAARGRPTPELPAGASSAQRQASAIAQDAGTAAVRSQPRVCPACPQCRAPTAWVAEYERFFCSRCDAYLEA